MSDQLKQAGLGDEIEMVVVTFTSRELAKANSTYFELDAPILLDPTRSTYIAYGLERASVRRVWGVRAGWKYAQLFWSGKRRMPVGSRDRRYVEDTRQLGGDFVLVDGLLQWGYWSEGPDDRPDPAEVVAQCLS